MRDGRILGLLKRAVRAIWAFEFGSRRAWTRLRGQQQYVLAGGCERCAKCCEEPSIQVNAFTWHLPLPRLLFLWWQKNVNGFDLLRRDRDAMVFTFVCSHFDATARRCDSYGTRPFMCRDYPRLLLDQPWPELFAECGYRAIDPSRKGLGDALDATNLSEEKKKELRKRLHVL